MTWWREAVARLRGTIRVERLEHDLDDEVGFHLDMQAAENMRSGMDPVEARRAARRGFGAIDPMKEAYRERRGFAFLETAAQDIRYAGRTLRKAPGFTASSIVVLALAIGANTAMFSVLNAVLIRPLPYRAPEQLAMLWTEVPSQSVRQSRSSYMDIERWRREGGSFSGIAFFDPATATLTGGAAAERISLTRISPNLFPLLGVAPALGRTFSDEEADQRAAVVLVSHRFWQSRLGASPRAIGGTVEIDGRPSQIIGVMPETFRYVAQADVWEAHTLAPDWETLRRSSGAGSWFAVGRLKAGVTIAQAQAEMNAIARGLQEQRPINEAQRGVSVQSLSVFVAGPRSRLALWLLAGAIALVLLLAVSNVAGLALARAAGRQKEIAVRAALGASRGRIARQLLAESITLTSVAGILGLGIAWAAVRAIRATQPVDLARISEAGVDGQVAAWALGLCLLTGVLVGLAPVCLLSRKNLRGYGAALTGDRAGTAGVGAGIVRRGLVATEFAMALILLVGAGLLIRSLWLVENVELGFEPRGVLSLQLSTSGFAPGAPRAEFYRQVLERVQALPGVERAGLLEDFFFSGAAERLIVTEDGAGTPGAHRLRSDEVSAGVFAALGVPLRKGRNFTAEDGPNAPRAAIVNETLARRLWAGRDPVGKRFKLTAADSERAWFTVVGVAGDVRRQGLESEPLPQMFVPLTQSAPRLATLLVRTSADDSLSMGPAVQAAVHEVDRTVPVYGVTTIAQQLDGFLAQRRFQTWLLTGFSIAALAMATVGIFGLIQYSVAARTREIGIRLAVGAQRSDVLRMILGEGLKLVLLGLVVGVAGSIALAKLAAGLLYGVAPTDPATFIGVVLVLRASAMTACYVPARRAMAVDPAETLR